MTKETKIKVMLDDYDKAMAELLKDYTKAMEDVTDHRLILSLNMWVVEEEEKIKNDLIQKLNNL